MSRTGAIRELLRLNPPDPGAVECPRCRQRSPCVSVDDDGPGDAQASRGLYHVERRNRALNEAFAAYCDLAGVDRVAGGYVA